MTEPLIESDLNKAVRVLYRRTASALASAMAETDTSFEMIDDRLRFKSGWAMEKMEILLTGDGDMDLNTISDLFFACGCVLSWSLQKQLNEAEE